MISQEDVGVKKEVVAVFVNGQELEVFLIIGGVFKDLLSLISAGNDVIESAFKFYTGLARHEQEKQMLDPVSIS
jgi:hypothetical protein